MIYLDIDGVLILAGERGNEDSVRARADMVRALVIQTGYPIIICSHRRRSDDIITLLKDLNLFFCMPYVNWKTPVLSDDELDPDLPIRGQEIAAHLANARPDRHVILDDDYCLPGQNHVQVDPTRGLSPDDIDRARAYLS